MYRIAPPGPVNVYVVNEYELDRLARGSPAALLLNFALFFLGTAVSGIGTLASIPTDSDRAYYTFLILASLSGMVGVVLVGLWWFAHRSAGDLLADIKSRMSPNPPT